MGCGDKPTGTVNCDLYVRDNGHREFPTTLDVKGIPNFVICDVQFLPFRSDVFSTVFSSHVIEHVPNPGLMFSEMHRVCKWNVKLKCPHGFGDRLARRNKRVHINCMSGAWFSNASKKLGCQNLSVDYSQYYYIPHKTVPLLKFPLELTVDLEKRRKPLEIIY